MSERNDEGHPDFDPTAETPYPSSYSGDESFPPPPPPAPSSWQTPNEDSSATEQIGAGATQPVPPPPPVGESPFGQSPYGQPGDPSPYGQPAPYGAAGAPYGSPGAAYGAPPPSYYQTQPSQQNTSALILTILSGVGVFACCAVTIIPLIFGIVALTKQTTDPVQSVKLTKWGWVSFAITAALGLFAMIALIVFGNVSSG